MVVKKVLSEILNKWMPFVPASVNAFFAIFTADATAIFQMYKTSMTVSTGWVSPSGFIGLFVFLLIALPAIAFYSVTVGPILISPLVINPREKFIGKFVAGSLFYLVTTFALGVMNPFELATQKKQDTAVLFEILSGSAPKQEVGLEAFTWGVLGSPKIEFTIQMAVVIFGVYLIVRNFGPDKEYLGFAPEEMVAWGAILGSIGVMGWLVLFKPQIFPVSGRLGLGVQALRMYTWCSIVAGVLSTWAYKLLRTVFRDPDIRKPRRGSMMFFGALLMAEVLLTGSGFWGLLSWVTITGIWLKERDRIEERLGISSPSPPQPEVN